MSPEPRTGGESADRDATIAFQGHYGAYSDMACRSVFPEIETMPCASFEDVFAAVRDGESGWAMIPIENSVAGRVADIHHLLPDSGLHIVGEHFQRVNHKLLAPKGATVGALKRVLSHEQALSQCRNFLRQNRLEPQVYADTAGAAKFVAEQTRHRRPSPRASPARSTGWRRWRMTSRMRSTTPRASS
jgi:prephenate dehydratase